MKTKVLFLIILHISIRCYSQNDTLNDCCNNNLYPYYKIGAELKYNGGFYAIKEIVNTNFSNSKFENINDNNGIVVVNFQVNCFGSITNLHSKSYNLEYVESKINQLIINNLTNSVLSLKNWILSNNEKGEKMCYHKFLSFKIVNGKIIEILPK